VSYPFTPSSALTGSAGSSCQVEIGSGFLCLERPAQRVRRSCERGHRRDTWACAFHLARAREHGYCIECRSLGNPESPITVEVLP